MQELTITPKLLSTTNMLHGITAKRRDIMSLAVRKQPPTTHTLHTGITSTLPTTQKKPVNIMQIRMGTNLNHS